MGFSKRKGRKRSPASERKTWSTKKAPGQTLGLKNKQLSYCSRFMDVLEVKEKSKQRLASLSFKYLKILNNLNIVSFSDDMYSVVMTISLNIS